MVKNLKEWSSKHRELWLDFETWLHKTHGKTIPDLSWNEYIEKSKEYNSERTLGKEGI